MPFPGFTDQFTSAPIAVSYPNYLSLTLTADTSPTILQWPFISPESPTPFATVMQCVANDNNANILTLPNALYASQGISSYIINTSGTAFELTDNAGNSLGIIEASGNPIINSYFVTLTDNTTQGGIWVLTAFGAGAIYPAINELIDHGTDTLGKVLNGGLAVITDAGTEPGQYLKSNILFNTYIDPASYTLSQGDRGTIIVWEEEAGTGLLNLMPAVEAGDGFIFAIKNNSTNSVITLVVSLGSGDIIDITTLGPGTSSFFISNGLSPNGAWTSLGYGLNTIPSTFVNVIVQLQDGSSSNPSLTFANDTSLGIYRSTTPNSILNIVQTVSSVPVEIASFQANTTYPTGLVILAEASTFTGTEISLGNGSQDLAANLESVTIVASGDVFISGSPEITLSSNGSINLASNSVQQQGISIYSLMRAYA
jgi:hypothetical protein